MEWIKLEENPGFRFTKVQVPFSLSACPSDDENSHYFLDVNCDHLCQENCYIGSQEIQRIDIRRIQKAETRHAMVAPRWMVEILIPGVKTEKEVLRLLDQLCRIFTFQCGIQHSLFQYSGLAGFTYQNISVQRRYAQADGVFGDYDINFFLHVESRCLSTLPETVFSLPQAEPQESPLAHRLRSAFLTAMRCRDAVSRYILLYYLFEILYQTDAYQQIKANSEKSPARPGRRDANQKRSELLCQYLQQEFGLREYRSFGENHSLQPSILFDIIQTRNDLAHRADTSKLSAMLYHHLLPILQRVVTLVT